MTVRLLAFVLVWLPALAPAGASSDPLSSAACARARAELESVLPDPAASGERLQHARRRAAEACLGRASGRERSGAPYPVQVVPPTLAAPARTAPAPAITTAPPPVPIPRPTVITACDPGGCWDSQGRRLNQMGPLLMGPGGVCTPQGGVVQCP